MSKKSFFSMQTTEDILPLSLSFVYHAFRDQVDGSRGNEDRFAVADDDGRLLVCLNLGDSCLGDQILMSLPPGSESFYRQPLKCVQKTSTKLEVILLTEKISCKCCLG